MSLQNGKYVAIKRMKTIFRSIEQVNSLREIQALKRLANYPNIIKLYEVLYDRHTGKLALVFELMTCNLYEFGVLYLTFLYSLFYFNTELLKIKKNIFLKRKLKCIYIKSYVRLILCIEMVFSIEI